MGREICSQRVDIGIDEVGPKVADFTRNGKIDWDDLRLFLEKWLVTVSPETVQYDVIFDGEINMLDFSKFASEWLWQADWYER